MDSGNREEAAGVSSSEAQHGGRDGHGGDVAPLGRTAPRERPRPGAGRAVPPGRSPGFRAAGGPARGHGLQPGRPPHRRRRGGERRGPGRVPPGLPNPGPLRGAEQPQDLDLPDRREPVPQPPPLVAPTEEGLLPASRRADPGRPGADRRGGSRPGQPLRGGASPGALRAGPGGATGPQLRPPRDPAAAGSRRALVRGDRRHPGHPGRNREEPAGPRARGPARAAPGLPGRGGSDMTCTRVRSQLSSYLDGDLGPAAARTVGSHLESLRAAIGMLAELPTLSPSEGIAARVFDRLEVETRGPGLAMVFRSSRARFFFNDTATTEIYTLSLHDALPIPLF